MTEIEKRAEAQNKQRKNEAGRWRKWVRIYVIVEAIVFVFALRSVFVPILLMLLLITGVLLILRSPDPEAKDEKPLEQTSEKGFFFSKMQRKIGDLVWKARQTKNWRLKENYANAIANYKSENCEVQIEEDGIWNTYCILFDAQEPVGLTRVSDADSSEITKVIGNLVAGIAPGSSWRFDGSDTEAREAIRDADLCYVWIQVSKTQWEKYEIEYDDEKIAISLTRIED